jgi:hypothetical protein
MPALKHHSGLLCLTLLHPVGWPTHRAGGLWSSSIPFDTQHRMCLFSLITKYSTVGRNVSNGIVFQGLTNLSHNLHHVDSHLDGWAGDGHSQAFISSYIHGLFLAYNARRGFLAGPNRSVQSAENHNFRQGYATSGPYCRPMGRPVWQEMSTYSLKFHLGPPCPTLVCPAGGLPTK